MGNTMKNAQQTNAKNNASAPCLTSPKIQSKIHGKQMQKTMQVHHVLLLQKYNAKSTANKCKKQCKCTMSYFSKNTMQNPRQTNAKNNAGAPCLTSPKIQCKIHGKQMQKTMQVHHVLLLQKYNAKSTANKCKKTMQVHYVLLLQKYNAKST